MIKSLYTRVFLLTLGLFGSLAVTFLLVPSLVGAQSETSNDGYIYLSQVPYTGFGDVVKLVGFLIIVALWSLLVVMVVKSDKVKEIMHRFFRNVNEEPEYVARGAGAGYVIDLNSNQVLNMNMNPVHDLSDTYVSKHNFSDNGNGKNNAVANETSSSSLNGHVNSASSSNGDLMQEVNTFMGLVVRGDEHAVFEHLRRMKAKGVDSSEFASNVVLELDAVYRSKMDGETNRKNVVLSQTLSAWNRVRIEAVISSLLTIVDQSYSDSNVGAKVAIMRIMRAL
ncbi:MAG: hypothetical protein A3H57_00370 [Candidatus Taylorbacteria bacterium RIFCSPLOWO2_02_FULL_43_11]|uniref:Uncharacterized protein n=1 Tax=Candidatus Taylorbacteria bacterium RIFCSPHIGHO2_02_FULL_43_32b TaxID=1802306 RepID=A0A1G2MGW4_9BACT|nr:MAG: hypothetical protein A2743_04345 [Candidatus Taylorbacteria bacterium RIFCSPHIGHO2_01_FULL_43_47]OHA22281.1 MAG: hypothetical protein A3C72_04250 [Candidatus Taylorbacteria bacterium RIFCSPHIGHO2_02_FULL_43_32b]OHA29338.1 MAG: hypothetical protein A3B08_04205 [Candidatus Taylorbacteria bacterium RIFCSPLOWO2_01_FULL_43_44]OHA36448.1 MAG: hypothetical protein A3H57_00370 [Candidatus Taylorbacteria bacterium RIFCSPLOWO2_02_FULL_43_11]